jgi:hypothetical protein
MLVFIWRNKLIRIVGLKLQRNIQISRTKEKGPNTNGNDKKAGIASPLGRKDV